MSARDLARAAASLACGAALIGGIGWAASAVQEKPGSAKAGPASGTYEIDAAHSFALFKIGHLGVSNAYGRFDQTTGTVVFDAADPAKSSIRIAIDAGSVSTGNAQRDAHLKSPDFFNVAEFPELTFESRSIAPKADGKFEVTGAFELHGVEKTITAPVELLGHGEFGQLGTRIGFESRFTIRRGDYGMDYQPALLGDEVTVVLAIEAVKK